MYIPSAYIHLASVSYVSLILRTSSGYRIGDVDTFEEDKFVLERNESLHHTLHQLASLDYDESAYNQTHNCGYGKRDLWIADERELDRNGERNYALTDPRSAVGWNSGILRGFAARFIKLVRGIANTRAIAVELTGDQASQLVQAQYGIVTAVVPKACFAALEGQLQNGNLTIEQVDARRPNLLKILKEDIPVGCSNGKIAKTKGKAAANMLKPLWHGYWSIYEPETVRSASVISARNLDPLYVDKGDRRLRQIWHYAKNHIYQKTQTIVRHQMFHTRSEKERVRLTRTMKNLIKLQGMREARLEFMEVDRFGSCISAQKNEVANLLNAFITYQSARFRVTLYFRERRWQQLASDTLNTIKHPIYSIKRWGTFKADEWDRHGHVHRIVMIVTPMLQTAAVAGLVLGLATMGTTTFASLFVEHALQLPLVAQSYFETSFLMIAINKLVQAPITAAVMDDALSAGEASFLQQFYHGLDDKDVVIDVRQRLQADVEKIMSSKQLVKEFKAFQRESTKNAKKEDDFDVTSLQEEARRIISDIVYGGFVNEVTPVIQDLMLRERRKKDPNYGWLNWKQWQLFRKGTNSKQLKGGRLRWVGKGRKWEGKVVNVGRKILCLGLCDRKVTVEVDGKGRTLTMSSRFKANVHVFDPAAYHRSQPGWLLWNDWSDYRVSSDSRELLHKEIYVDENLAGCDKLWKQNPNGSKKKQKCITLLDANQHGITVTRTSWKFLGLGDRTLYLDFGNRTKCIKTKVHGKDALILTPRLKMCLRVNDGHAYEKYIRDAPRREQEQRWMSGDLSATTRINEDVIKAMACAPVGHASAEESAENGNTVLRRELGRPSVELQMQTADDGVDDDPEVKEVLQESEKAFQEANQDRCMQQQSRWPINRHTGSARGLEPTLKSPTKRARAAMATPSPTQECFPSSAMVRLKGHGAVRIDSLRTGDLVLSVDGAGRAFYDEVSFYSLADPQRVRVTFVSLQTSNNETLRVTGSHHLSTGAECCRSLKAASDLRVGDTVWTIKSSSNVAMSDLIKSIEFVVDDGLHSPVMLHGGHPIVNNVVTSFDNLDSLGMSAQWMPYLSEICTTWNMCGVMAKAIKLFECLAKGECSVRKIVPAAKLDKTFEIVT